MDNTPDPRPVGPCKPRPATDSRDRDSAESPAVGPTTVVDAWDQLPDAVRQGILAMVRATRKQQ